MIVRVNKTTNYTVMSNYHLMDRRLSLKAKGLLSVVLALPEDWQYSIAGLAAISKEKESAIKSALDELKECGYLVVTKKMPNETNSGRIEYVWDFYEMAKQEKQKAEKQTTEVLGFEVLGVENQRQLNTNNRITKEQNTNELNTKYKKERKSEVPALTFDEILDSVPVIANNADLRETFIDFIKMRKLIKKPLTDRALKGIVNKAYELGKGEPDQMIKVLEQSIEGSWQGLYELKEEPKKPKREKTLQELIDEGVFDD